MLGIYQRRCSMFGPFDFSSLRLPRVLSSRIDRHPPGCSPEKKDIWAKKRLTHHWAQMTYYTRNYELHGLPHGRTRVRMLRSRRYPGLGHGDKGVKVNAWFIWSWCGCLYSRIYFRSRYFVFCGFGSDSDTLMLSLSRWWKEPLGHDSVA